MTDKLELLIKATDKASKPLGDVTKQVGELDKKSGLASGVMGKLSGVMAGVAGIAVGGLAIGVGAVATALGVVSGASFNLSNDIKNSQNNIQAQLGATEEEAKALTATAKNIFKEGFGDNFTQVSDATIEAKKQLGEYSDKLSELEFQKVVEGAMAIEKASKGALDVAGTTQAVKVLMEQFGISSEHALDLIAKGYQNGLNNSGDLLDTLTEYAPQYGDMNATAEQFFATLDSGASSGALGTDKIADAFKELGISIREDGSTIDKYLKEIGLSSDDLNKRLAKGESITTIYQDIQKGLSGVTDKSRRATLAQEIFKSMGEDATQTLLAGIKDTNKEYNGQSGSVEKLKKQNESFGTMMSKTWRTILLRVAPFTTKIMEMVSTLFPIFLDSLNSLFDFIETFLAPVFEKFVGFFDTIMAKITEFSQGSNPEMEELMANLRLLFEEFMVAVQPILEQFLISAEAIWNTLVDEVFPKIIPTLNSIIEFIRFVFPLIVAIVQPIMIGFIQIFENVYRTIIGVFSGIMTYIQGWIDVVIGVFTGDGERVKKGFAGMFEGLGQIATSIFKGIFNNIMIQMETGYNRIKDVANKAGAGGAVPDISFPRLNQGGRVKAGQAYIVGDNPNGSLNATSELFVPETNGRVLSASQTRQAMGQGGGSNIKFDIQINSNQHPESIADAVTRRVMEILESQNRNPRFT
jgi:hypothetical protein